MVVKLKPKKQLDDMFLGEYLGLGDITKLKVRNPLKELVVKEDDEGPHVPDMHFLVRIRMSILNHNFLPLKHL